MSSGSIIERVGKRGTSYLLKYNAGVDGAGKRQQRYKTVRGTKKEAKAELRRLLSAVEDGSHVDPDKATVGDWLLGWHAGYKPFVSAMTHQRYGQLIRLHLIPNLGYLPLQKLRAEHIRGAYAVLRTSGKKSQKHGPEIRVGLNERTIRHTHRVLLLALRFAEEENRIRGNPASRVKLPRQARNVGPDGATKKIKALEKQEVEDLLAGVSGSPIFPIVALAVKTGMRRGEVLALRWCDIDFQRKTIRIERSVEDTTEFGMRFVDPKTESSRRVIGMDKDLSELLQGLRRRQAQISPAALLFPRDPALPAAAWKPVIFSSLFSRHATRAGFKGLRFHDLRHTHATQQLLDGVPVNAVAERLGHSTPVTTLTVYGHVLKRAEEQAVNVSESIGKGAMASYFRLQSGYNSEI